MFRTLAAPLLSAALISSSIAPAALASPLTIDKAAPGGVTLRYQRPGAASPRLIAGLLTAPSTASPVSVARAYLATRPEILAGIELSSLRALAPRRLNDGSLVRHVQHVNGVEVLGGDVLVRLDRQGRVRWASGSPVRLPAGFTTAPALDVDAAIGAIHASGRFSLGPSVIRRDRVKLIVDATRGGEARLAYVIDLPGNFERLEQLRVRVDAQTGALMGVENRVRRGAAGYAGSVFEGNPVSTPDLQQVDLGPWLDAQTGTVFLKGPDVDVYGCLDKKECASFAGFLDNVHTCTVSRGASTTVGGDFLDFGRPADDSEGEDEFAEVQMFFHVNMIYGFFRGLGLDDLQEKPLPAVTNMRLPIDLNNFAGSLPLATCQNGVPQAAHTLYPFDNAFYSSDGSLVGIEGGVIAFGQGSGGDLSYDGDVVYHEFTHAVMSTLTPNFGLNSIDEFGEDPTTGGMTEGMADYFSSAFLNDPDLGEYAGPALGLPPGPMRTLKNTKTCPASLWNEVHEDGEPWAGALWDGREALPGSDKPAYDQAVYNVMAALESNDDQLTTAAKIAAEVTTLINADAATAVTAKYAARGLDDCNDRVIDMTAAGASKQLLFVSGTDMGLTPAPGPVQFLINVPAGGAEAITISVQASQANGGFGGGGTVSLELIAKPGSDAILWTYSGGTATSDATKTGAMVCGSSCQGEVVGPFAAGPVVLQLQGKATGAILQNIRFVTRGTGGPGTVDAGPVDGIDAGDGGDNPSDASDGDDDGGCGCTVGGQDDSPFAGLAILGGLALFGFGVTRRRRK